ncbi:hypothetical protein [Ruminococcus sp.]|uniref:hypothetical protein n=1 Tax=Ruminococcus sp. TaxID=41978 RepID=UPI00386D3FF9
MKQEDAKIIYADIFTLPHHQSATRKHMSRYDRAAQFAPFKALTGYDDMIAEEARYTDGRIELSDNEIEIINAMIGEIQRRLEDGDHPRVTAVYFKPDPYKKGGSYETFKGRLKKIDALEKTLVFYGSEDIEDKRVPTVKIELDRVVHVLVEG